MKQITLHGFPVKIGDKVWNSRQGWELVRCINPKDVYPIETDTSTFEEGGFKMVGDKYPSLFWKEQTFDLTKPLPDLKLDDKVIIWDNDSAKYGRHFCRFDPDGKIVTFDGGLTSWTSGGRTTAWSNWELPDD